MAAFRAPVENELRAFQYLGAFTKINHEAALRVCADQKVFHAVSPVHLIFFLAAWCRPYFACSAPVNALLTSPNTSDSTSARGNAGLRNRRATLSLQGLSAPTVSRHIVHVDPPVLFLRPSVSHARSRRQSLTRKYKQTRPKALNVAPPTIAPESEAEPLARAFQISPEPAPQHTTVRNKRIPRYIFIARNALRTVCRSFSSQR